VEGWEGERIQGLDGEKEILDMGRKLILTLILERYYEVVWNGLILLRQVVDS
jgi:hypothetical protein